MKRYKDKKWLKKQYNDNELSTTQIGIMENVSKVTILYWLVKFEIERRSNSEGSKILVKQKRTKFIKGNKWSFKKGNMIGKETRFKKGERRDFDNTNWKGIKASYSAIHKYIQERKEKPNKCEICNIEKKLELSFNHELNKSTRNIENYKYLCSKCHKLRDKKLRKILNRKRLMEIF